VLAHLPARSFWWVRATIETGLSLVKKNYYAEVTISQNVILWAMKMNTTDTTEAARRLNVTPTRVRAMINSGRLKATKVGIVWMIDPKDLEAVKERKVGRPRKSRKNRKLSHSKNVP
jgi:excisionase family DNA binding protein